MQHEIRELSEKLHDTKVFGYFSQFALEFFFVLKFFFVQQTLSAENATEKLLNNVTAADVAELQQNLKQLQVEQILGQQATNDLADPHAAVIK